MAGFNGLSPHVEAGTPILMIFYLRGIATDQIIFFNDRDEMSFLFLGGR